MKLSLFGAGKAILSLMFILTLSACYPTSQHPIEGEPMVNLDATFSGTWKGELSDSPGTVLFIQQSQDDTGTFHIGGLLVLHHEERASLNEGWIEFEGEVVVIRGETFLSAQLNQTNGEPVTAEEKSYTLFRLVLEENTMNILGLNDLVTIELVNRGALEGTVDRTQATPAIRLTSSGAALRGFLNTANLDELFSSSFAQLIRTQ